MAVGRRLCGRLTSVYFIVLYISINDKEARVYADTLSTDDAAFSAICQALLSAGSNVESVCNGNPCRSFFNSEIVKCGSTNAVISITLAGRAYKGRIDESIGNFSQLQYLSIINTSMTGELPSSISSLSNLVALEIVANNFTGELPRLSKLEDLKSFNLSRNLFNGSISNETFPSSCSLIDISQNKLTGQLGFVNVTSATLVTLDASSNLLSGSLPNFLENSPLLSTLDVANNNLSGVLPSLFEGFVGNSTSTIFLNVSTNDLSGSIPQTMLAAVNRFQHFLDMSMNNFTGYVDPQVAAQQGIRFDGNPYLCICKTPDPHNSNGLLIGLISGLVIIIAFLSTLIFFGNVYMRKRGVKNRTLSLSDAPVEFTHEELITATNGFHFENLLGKGGFGLVYKGTLGRSCEVAIKVLNRNDAHGQGEEEYSAEVNIISQIHHRNLVQLLGFCKEGDNRILVYEYVSNGSLAFHLHEAKVKLTWRERCSIVVGAARGLAYLHEDCSPRVVHRDIKPSNILLTETFEPKVADFGLARLIPEGVTTVTTKVLGTWGYVAPEIISAERVGEQADVFSFGMVVLEIISGKTPSGETDILDLAKRCKSDGAYSNLIEAGLETQCNFEEVAEVTTIALLCLVYDPMERPSMGTVVRMLEDIFLIGDYVEAAR